MIELTRINGNAIVLNSDLIKTAEASPDTMLTLITGEKMIVREECGVVIDRIVAYRAGLLAAVMRLQPNDADLSDVAAGVRLEAASRIDCSGSINCPRATHPVKEAKRL